jgi:molecular chaperone GrpE (heat shock protein)
MKHKTIITVLTVVFLLAIGGEMFGQQEPQEIKNGEELILDSVASFKFQNAGSAQNISFVCNFGTIEPKLISGDSTSGKPNTYKFNLSLKYERNINDSVTIDFYYNSGDETIANKKATRTVKMKIAEDSRRIVYEAKDGQTFDTVISFYYCQTEIKIPSIEKERKDSTFVYHYRADEKTVSVAGQKEIRIPLTMKAIKREAGFDFGQFIFILVITLSFLLACYAIYKFLFSRHKKDKQQFISPHQSVDPSPTPTTKDIERQFMANLLQGFVPNEYQSQWNGYLDQIITSTGYRQETQQYQTQIETLKRQINRNIKESEDREKQLLSEKENASLQKNNEMETIKQQLSIVRQNFDAERKTAARLQAELAGKSLFVPQVELFFKALRTVYVTLVQMDGKVTNTSSLKPLISFALLGQKQGKTNVIFDAVRSYDHLLEIFGKREVGQLREVTADDFFTKYINSHFLTTLTQLVQLYCLSRADASMDLVQEFDSLGVRNEIELIYNTLSKTLEADFGVKPIVPVFGKDVFNQELHQKNNSSRMTELFPQAVSKAATGTVIDLLRIGFTKSGVILIKSNVVCKV